MQHYGFIVKLFNFNDFNIRIISLGATITSLFCTFSNDFLGISALLFALLFFVMIIDYITGIAASKREKKILTSKRGLDWVFKFGSYIVFLALSFSLNNHIVEKNIESLLLITSITHFYILLHIFYWEMKSVDENFERLGYNFKILGLFNKIFSTMRGTLESSLKKKKEDSE
jgi:phage-related holin